MVMMFQNLSERRGKMTNLLAELYESNRSKVIERYGKSIIEQDPRVGSHVVVDNQGLTSHSDLIITYNSQGYALAVTDRVMLIDLSASEVRAIKKEHKRLHKELIEQLTGDFVLFYSEDKDLIEMVYCKKEWYDCVVFIAYEEHAF